MSEFSRDGDADDLLAIPVSLRRSREANAEPPIQKVESPVNDPAESLPSLPRSATVTQSA